MAAGAGAVATAFSEEFSALDAGRGSLGASTFGNCCGRLSGGVITVSTGGTSRGGSGCGVGAASTGVTGAMETIGGMGRGAGSLGFTGRSGWRMV